MAQKRTTKPSSSEETVRAIVREGSPGGRSETTGVRFVKEVGLKPGVKERERVIDEQSGESKEEKVMGEGIGESEMEELVPKWYQFDVPLS